MSYDRYMKFDMDQLDYRVMCDPNSFQIVCALQSWLAAEMI